MKWLMEASAPASSKCVVKTLVILKNQATAVWSSSSCLMLSYLQISVAQPTETATAVTTCMFDKLLSSASRHKYVICVRSQEGKQKCSSYRKGLKSYSKLRNITCFWQGGMEEDERQRRVSRRFIVPRWLNKHRNYDYRSQTSFITCQTSTQKNMPQ